MGFQDRDRMQHDRRADRPHRRSPGYAPLFLGVAGVIAFFYAVMLGHARWTGIPPAPSRPTPPATVAPPAVADPDPFKGDPTWHTGPRPVIPAVPPSPRAATATVTKCSVNGKVTYSAANECSSGTATLLPIDPGPDVGRIAAAQAELQRGLDRANAQVEAVLQQRVAADQAQRVADAVRGRPSAASPLTECAALADAIVQLDARARLPQSAYEQDRIRAERRHARDRQHALRC